MNPIYKKNDVIALAEQIFLGDLQNADNRSIETKMLAGAAIFAAEVFYNIATAYHGGELKTTLTRAHESDELEKERRQTSDRRQGDRRTEAKGCAVCAPQTSSEEDETFARIEQLVKELFLNATLNSIFRNVAKV